MAASKYALVFLTILIGLSGCKKEGCTDDQAINYDSEAKKDDGSCEYATSTLVVHMKHMLDGEDAEMNMLQYMSPAGNEYSITKLFYFISDIVLHSSEGDVEVDAAHYIDLEDSSTLTWETGLDINPGEYDSVSFIFGLDEEKNVNGYFTTLPEVNMAWPDVMGGGYHYMQMEGWYDSMNTDGALKGYLTHLGPTNGNQYYVKVGLDGSGFSVPSDRNSTTNVDIFMHINNWYQQPHLYDFNNYSGIMMNESVQAMMQENGANVFTLDKILIE